MGIHCWPQLSRSGYHVDDVLDSRGVFWKKVGAFLSDISGAFDKVYKPYLIAKLQAHGVGPDVLNFLDAYLSPRHGQVCVQGKLSEKNGDRK